METGLKSSVELLLRVRHHLTSPAKNPGACCHSLQCTRDLRGTPGPTEGRCGNLWTLEQRRNPVVPVKKKGEREYRWKFSWCAPSVAQRLAFPSQSRVLLSSLPRARKLPASGIGISLHHRHSPRPINSSYLGKSPFSSVGLRKNTMVSPRKGVFKDSGSVQGKLY